MRKKVLLKNGRSCLASYSLTKPAVPRWLVFVPESAAYFQHGTRNEFSSMIGAKQAKNFNYLVLNRPGVLPKKINATAFENSFRRKRRIEDALAVIDSVVPPMDDIYLVGYSEGAYLAPQIALEDTRVKAIVMIGGGTRGWLKEELSNAGPRERGSLAKKIREIYQHPRSTQKWNGFSFATWYSYREDSTLRALKKLKIPALAILGARDRTIDFKTTYNDLKTLNKKMTLRLCIFKNCGHSFVSHWSDTWYEIKKFLDEHKNF